MRVKSKTRRSGLVGAIIALTLLFAVVAAGCGSKKSSTENTTSTASSGTSSSGKTFANLRVTWDAPDYLDPGLAYTVAAWQVMWNVYAGLVGYPHANGTDGAKLVPYLAQSMPTISNGGKVYKFTLRPNLKYSDGRPV